MADFKNLVVWQKAHKLTLATVGKVEDVRGNAGKLIRDQLLRSVLSIQSNIAEGSSKRSDRDFARYVRISMGSATESENHMILLRDLLLIDAESFNELDKQLDEVGKMLSGLEKRLTRDASSA
jgi:four helix bundle protein